MYHLYQLLSQTYWIINKTDSHPYLIKKLSIGKVCIGTKNLLSDPDNWFKVVDNALLLFQIFDALYSYHLIGYFSITNIMFKWFNWYIIIFNTFYNLFTVTIPSVIVRIFGTWYSVYCHHNFLSFISINPSLSFYNSSDGI